QAAGGSHPGPQPWQLGLQLGSLGDERQDYVVSCVVGKIGMQARDVGQLSERVLEALGRADQPDLVAFTHAELARQWRSRVAGALRHSLPLVVQVTRPARTAAVLRGSQLRS